MLLAALILLTLQINSEMFLALLKIPTSFVVTRRRNLVRGDGHGKAAKTTTQKQDRKQTLMEIHLVSFQAPKSDTL